MKFGSPFSAGFGNPENCLTRLDAEVLGRRIRVTVQSRTDIPAAWYEVTINSRHMEYIYLTAGETRTLSLPSVPGVAAQAIAVLRCGPYPASMIRAARWFDGMTSRRVSHWWTWTPEVIGSVDAAGATVCASWSLTGLQYGHVDPVTGQSTRGRIRVELTVTGSGSAAAVGVDLYRGNTLLATGDGQPGGTVTLTGTLAGSVAIGPTAATGTEYLEVRWPAAMSIKRKASTSTNPAPVVATPAFDRSDAYLWTESADLTAGATYQYSFAPVSDTGETGTYSTPVSIVLSNPPAAPTALAYASGNAAACVLSFVPSVTAGATHNVYLQQPGDEAAPESPCAATVDGTSITLPAVTGYPGTARVRVHAVKDGVEERIGAVLALEFNAAGAYVAARPNAPTISRVTVTGGLTLAVEGSYPVVDQAGVATQLGLYAYDGSWPLTPDAVGNLGIVWNGVREATVSLEFASAGWKRIRLYALTAAGVESLGYAEQSVYVSDAAPAGSTPDGYNSRG